ncbi:hypothetical protein, partial [Acidaminococcus fermentans]|uniref:hypothetical protein n=1 Tax=Acidaminococcus fermentans TaxID=905 RepID=UPI003076EC36
RQQKRSCEEMNPHFFTAPLNNGNSCINHSRRGSRPGCPSNQRLAMCCAGRRACVPYGLFCSKAICKIDFEQKGAVKK